MDWSKYHISSEGHVFTLTNQKSIQYLKALRKKIRTKFFFQRTIIFSPRPIRLQFICRYSSTLLIQGWLQRKGLVSTINGHLWKRTKPLIVEKMHPPEKLGMQRPHFSQACNQYDKSLSQLHGAPREEEERIAQKQQTRMQIPNRWARYGDSCRDSPVETRPEEAWKNLFQMEPQVKITTRGEESVNC